MAAEKMIVPIIAPKHGIDTTKEAACSVIGPDLNGDLSEVKTKKFGAAQTDADPYDAAKRLPRKINKKNLRNIKYLYIKIE